MQRLSSRWSPIPILTVAALVASCGGGADGGMPPPTTAVAKTVAGSGDAQTGTVAQPLTDPIRVIVTESGVPAPDVTVAWSSTVAGATLVPASGPTDANGIASSAWSLGTAAGGQTARATVAGAGGSPVAFTATAAAAAAATLAQAGGDGQTGDINSPLALPLAAKVTDQFGNAVGGTPVNWSATGAAVSAATVPSDATGLSQVTVTLGGAAGAITIVAEADGLTGSPLTFDATAVIPTPPPTSIGVTVRNDNFLSARNGSVNPAVDTVAVNGTVTWTWAAGATTHNVTSTGSPSFTSSATKSAPATHAFTFTVAGTYRYYCTIHGAPTSGMRGTIVVK